MIPQHGWGQEKVVMLAKTNNMMPALWCSRAPTVQYGSCPASGHSWYSGLLKDSLFQV